jgi:hypothetical protein
VSAAEVGTVWTIATAAMAPAATVSKSVLAAVALIVPVRAGILLRLAATARDECGEAADILSAFMAALVRLRIGLLLVLLVLLVLLLVLLVLLLLMLPVVHLLVTRWKRLRVARQIRLLLRLARRVTRFVLAHILIIVIVAFVAVVAAAGLLWLATGSAALLMRLLLVVVRILLTKLFLRRGDQAEIVLGVLIIILGGHRVARPLRVARKLNVFFRDMRSRASDFDVGPVRFVNARERILTFAVVASPPHALLTVSHVVPVRQPFTLSRHSRRTLNSPCKSKQIPLRGRTCVMSAPKFEMSCPLIDSRSNPLPRSQPQRCQPLVTRTVLGFEIDAPNR